MEGQSYIERLDNIQAYFGEFPSLRFGLLLAYSINYPVQQKHEDILNRAKKITKECSCKTILLVELSRPEEQQGNLPEIRRNGYFPYTLLGAKGWEIHNGNIECHCVFLE